MFKYGASAAKNADDEKDADASREGWFKKMFQTRSIIRALAVAQLSLGLLFGLTGAASAQRRDDGATAETLGVGDAVRASVWGPAALYYNPAGLLKIPIFVVQSTYNYLDGQDGHAFQIGIVDGRTSEHAALGVSYNYVTADRDGYHRFGNQLRLGMGTGYRSGDVGIFAGVGVRYMDMRFRPLSDSTPAYAEEDLDAWTGDVGLMFDFADRIRFGVVGQNLLDTKHSEALRTIGLGLSFVFSTLEVGASMDIDISNRLDKTITSYSFGADYGIGDAFRIRMGLVIDALKGQERVSTGFGWSNPSLAIDLGWSTATVDPTDMLFGLSVRYVPAL